MWTESSPYRAGEHARVTGKINDLHIRLSGDQVGVPQRDVCAEDKQVAGGIAAYGEHPAGDSNRSFALLIAQMHIPGWCRC
jgi:hypothetical protein